MRTAHAFWRGIAVVATLAVAALAVGTGGASAQTEQQRKWCYDPAATDPQTIEGCTALEKSGKFRGRDLAIVLYNRGLSYENTEKYTLAMSDFSQAIGLDPNYADAFDDRGNVYLKTGENERALADYNRAMALKPNTALYFNNRGYTYYKMSDLDRALADLNRAISLDPKIPRAYVNRALVHFAKHDCKGTADDLMVAKRLNWKYTVPDEMKAQCGDALAKFLAP
jgi:tetratricopeptide (TPR) repeat protein